MRVALLLGAIVVAAGCGRTKLDLDIPDRSPPDAASSTDGAQGDDASVQDAPSFPDAPAFGDASVPVPPDSDGDSVSCKSFQMLCGDACVDLTSDPKNCGSCGHVCPAGTSCSGGTCTCSAGHTLCNGTCVDTYSDTSNCGTCGQACAPGQSCNAGACTCPSTAPTLCSTGCSDTQNDSNNCGACGNVCTGTTTTCTAGTCALVPPVTLASGLSSPQAMALDSSYVYWVGGTTPGPDGVMRMPKAGGVVTTLVANELAPYGIAVDATSVYYTTTYSSTSSPGIVKKVPLDGSSPPTALLFQRAWGLALSGTTLLLGTGDIEAMPTTGGSVTLLALGQNGPFAVAADASNVYWVTPPPDGGVVASVPITGGTVTTLATGQNGGPYGLDRGIAVDASNVYVTNNTGGTVVSVPKTGGGGVTTLASGQASPWSVAVAGGYVYWTNNASNGPGSVMKVPVGGAAPPTAIATGQSQPWGIAVDDTYVYWTNSGAGAGAVMKTAR